MQLTRRPLVRFLTPLTLSESKPFLKVSRSNYLENINPGRTIYEVKTDRRVLSGKGVGVKKLSEDVHFLPGLGSKLDQVSTTIDDQIKVANSKLSGIGLELESAQRDIEALRASASAEAETEAVFRRISELEAKLTDLSAESEMLQREIVRCKLKDSLVQDQVRIEKLVLLGSALLGSKSRSDLSHGFFYTYSVSEDVSFCSTSSPV